jgi:signal recognition particle subunit SRP54
MFDQIAERFSKVVKTIRGQSHFTEANTQEILRDIRVALLEADVALPVVKTFLQGVQSTVLGQEVLQAVNPQQAFVAAVHQHLVGLLAGDFDEKARMLNLAVKPPCVILLAGLQGAGKTTTAAKLAAWIKTNHKKRVLLASADVYRPAAQEQLKLLAESLEVPFFDSKGDTDPTSIANKAFDKADREVFDVLIFDTAGRLAVDEVMMQEIKGLHALLKPAETLFVIDSMLGQDAANTAKAFSEALPLTGVVLTKVDGDARGGAALSVSYLTKVPVKFAGISEKTDGLQYFDADRMARRILGMGDVLSIVEDAEKKMDVEAAKKMADKLRKGGGFNLNDYLLQMVEMRKMGSLNNIMQHLPMEMRQKAPEGASQQAEKIMRRTVGMIHAMTPKERAQPELLKASRKIRIAKGAGVQVQEINQMLKQFEQTREMMKGFSKGGVGKMMRMVNAMRGGVGGRLGGRR